MTNPGSYKTVIKAYDEAQTEIQKYFPHFTDLIDRYRWDVVVSYVFARIEFAKHMTIYCGIVKLHQTDADLSWKAVTGDYLSRTRFRELFRTIFGKHISEPLLKKLESAEAVRDKHVHGKPVTPANLRKALVDTLKFAEEFNAFVYSVAQFRPFADLRGFKGAGKSLPKSTTRWILKGMNFQLN
ncbi:MAG: hypothetical protein KKG33_11865 [candidate division Zixibacteria bacterium]|nr:hypothetical protein [candidate division Zixibacteria bacterium]MBU1471524.1 hypothetical protein [candidate division Zixibacteria bacterium]MBU2626245.1 hypothetical protein [candidate division Zixibacteria bacterium]